MIFDKVDLGIRIVFIVFLVDDVGSCYSTDRYYYRYCFYFLACSGCFESAKLVRKIQDHVTEGE